MSEEKLECGHSHDEHVKMVSEKFKEMFGTDTDKITKFVNFVITQLPAHIDKIYNSDLPNIVDIIVENIPEGAKKAFIEQFVKQLETYIKLYQKDPTIENAQPCIYTLQKLEKQFHWDLRIYRSDLADIMDEIVQTHWRDLTL